MNWELLSYIVTVIGFPLAIFIFLYEQHQERLNEEDEVYELLSDNYQDFLHTVLDNPDLHLILHERTSNLSDEQKERMFVIFSMLISLFERAYLLLYNPPLSKIQKRRWASWNDYMEEWCRREDFTNKLPVLLKGEDPEFVSYLKTLSTKIKDIKYVDNIIE
jgi:hypothetical protein